MESIINMSKINQGFLISQIHVRTGRMKFCFKPLAIVLYFIKHVKVTARNS